jgi:biopolymer transport protein ExbB/TolQ
MFLVLVAMGTIEASMVEIPRALERREEVLSRLAQVLEEQSDDLERVSNDIVNVSKKLNSDLERMLKIKIPQASQGMQPKLKELLLIGAIGVLFGTVFGSPLVGFVKQGACQINSSFCSAAQISK